MDLLNRKIFPEFCFMESFKKKRRREIPVRWRLPGKSIVIYEERVLVLDASGKTAIRGFICMLVEICNQLCA